VTAILVIDGKKREQELLPVMTYHGLPIYFYGAFFCCVMGMITIQGITLDQVNASIDEYFRMRSN